MSGFATARFPIRHMTSGLVRGEVERLALEFLSTEVELSQTFASMAVSYRQLSSLTRARRFVKCARKGYETALFWYGKLQVDGILESDRAGSLIRRIENLAEMLREVETAAGVDEGAASVALAAFFPPHGQEHPIEPSAKDPLPAEKLTLREREVLQLIVNGDSTKEIAAKLKISFKTAVCHRSSIMGKLGTRNAAALVRTAIRMGLVEL